MGQIEFIPLTLTLSQRERGKEGFLSSAVWYLAVLYSCPHPLWMRRGAEGQTDQGKNLFERSELFLTPAGPSTAGCPGAKRRGRSNQGRLFFGDFLLAKQKKVTGRRATPGQQAYAETTPVRKDITKKKPPPTTHSIQAGD